MKLVRVEQMPAELEPDTLYHAEQYGCAVHLCPCVKCSEPSPGITRAQQRCRANTAIVPFWSDGWTLTAVDENPTLSPSILNRWCGAHYFIEDGRVRWV